jgi:hypothetical protein
MTFMDSMIVVSGWWIEKASLLQIQGMFVVDVFGTDGTEFVPEVEDRGHDDGNAEADGEENPVSGQENKQSNDGADGNNEGGTSF